MRIERRFLGVHLDLVNRCNLRCRMCHYALESVRNIPRQEMSDGVIERMVREVWPHTRELWLACGSEPLMSAQLAPIMERMRDSGIPCTQLVTNGVLLDETWALRCIRGGISGLTVSLDGATRSTYEAIRIGADFDRVLSNIRKLQQLKRELGAAKPALIVQSVLMPANMGEWSGLVHLAADLGAERLFLTPQIHYAEMSEKERLWDAPEAVNAALAGASSAARQRRLRLEMPPGYRSEPNGVKRRKDLPCAGCINPWCQLFIYSNGEATPCFQLFGKQSFGNLEHQSLADIFYGSNFRDLRDQLRSGPYGPHCHTCNTNILDELNFAPFFYERSIFG